MKPFTVQSAYWNGRVAEKLMSKFLVGSRPDRGFDLKDKVEPVSGEAKQGTFIFSSKFYPTNVFCATMMI